MTNIYMRPPCSRRACSQRKGQGQRWTGTDTSGPAFTWTDFIFFPFFYSRIRRSSACAPDAGLFMCLSPHRVPDRNHPSQHGFQSAEFPSTETLVIITVYYGPCHDIVFYSSVSLSGEPQKSPVRMRRAEEFQRRL